MLVPFGDHHLPSALELSRTEGWPHRYEDWELLRSLGHGLVVLDGSDVVGTALATPFGPVAVVNMVIVSAGWRGKGLGRALVKASMSLIEADQWRLVATEAGLPLYGSLGFEAAGEIVQHTGHVAEVQAPDGCRWAERSDGDVIEELDQRASGADRSAMICALQRVGNLAVAHDSHGTVQGYAALRPYGHGGVAGPVVAASMDQAQQLLDFLFATRAGQFLRVYTRQSRNLSRWLAARGLDPTSRGVAMRLGGATGSEGRTHIFALESQALG